MWQIVGGLSGATRMAIGAAVTVAIFTGVVVPLERAKARRGMVQEFRATAAEAERDELKRQIAAGQIVVESYQVQLRNVRAKEEAAADEIERRITENETLRRAAGRRCDLDDADVKFLRNER